MKRSRRNEGGWLNIVILRVAVKGNNEKCIEEIIKEEINTEWSSKSGKK